MNTKSNEISISDLINILKLRWIPILLAGVILAVLTFGYTKIFVVPQYAASAQMFVDTRRESSEGKDTYIQSSHINAAKELANTYIHIIKTNTIINSVIDELDLKLSYNALRAKINVQVVEDTQILRINVNDANPELALAIVTKLVELTPELINAKIDSGKLISIDSPVVTTAPVSPNTFRNTFVGFVVGVMIVYVFFLITRLLDNKIKSVEDIQKTLDLPVLGVIPTLDNISSK